MIVLQRLRTENRLLRQRIDYLEAESSALADRLVKGQVRNYVYVILLPVDCERQSLTRH